MPGKSHGWRSLVGCSPWGHEESDTTERLHFHFSLSCIGEGNGNPLQCPCLENPRDGGAWWAGVYGVAQSRTRLKRLSSSSSSKYFFIIFWEFIEPNLRHMHKTRFGTASLLYIEKKSLLKENDIIIDLILVSQIYLFSFKKFYKFYWGYSVKVR